MSENTPAVTGEQAPPEGEQTEAKTFDADYVANLRKEAARYRTEAKTNADAAKRLDALEQANKSEIDKAMDRVSKAEAELTTVPARVADALRTHLIALHDIDADDADLFLTANDPELLLKQVQRLTGRESDRRKKNNVVPREGSTSTSVAGDEREFVRGLFNSGG